MHAGLTPLAFHEQARTDAGRHARCVAHTLHARFVVGSLVRTVVVNVVSMLLTVLHTADAATDRRLAFVVFAQVLGIRQHGFEELQGLDHVSLVVDGHNRVHTDVLDHAQVRKILLSERHPEACALDRGEVDHQALDFLVVEQVALARSDVGIGQRLMNFERFGLHPLAILPVQALLRDLSDVDLGVEVRGKGLSVVARVAVDDIQVMNFVKVVLGGISREDRRHAGVESAAEDGAKSGLFEAFAISPLPRVFEMGFILRFVVGCVEIVATGLQAGLHNREILVGQGKVHHQFGLEIVEQTHELLHIVGIHLRGANIIAQAHVGNALGNRLALRFGAAGDHNFVEDVTIFGDFDGGHRGNTAGADDENFSHCG